MKVIIGDLAARGAENLAERCLAPAAGEKVLFLHHPSAAVDGTEAAVRTALLKCRARLLEVVLPDAGSPFESARDRDALESATASVAIGNPIPPPVSAAIIRALATRSLRHVHCPRLDVRVLASSARAEPEVVARRNAWITSVLEREQRLTCTSPAGTSIEVRRGLALPLVSDTGRPLPGRWDNVPSGTVYFHPGSISGEYVADRLVVSAIVPSDPRALRNHPLRVRFENGRAVAHSCDDATLSAAFARYLASHKNAPRVGFISIPTNHLAMAELGHINHDALLPGIRVQLGFSDAPNTRAPFDLEVGCRLVGRRVTVTAGTTVLVDDGRSMAHGSRAAARSG